jgi:hypothetical protein
MAAETIIAKKSNVGAILYLLFFGVLIFLLRSASNKFLSAPRGALVKTVAKINCSAADSYLTKIST